MTTCTNNKHGCRIIKHPDDDNCWFCPNCHRKFIEDPGFPFILLIIGMIVAIVGVLGILSSKPHLNNQGSYQQSSQLPQNITGNGFDSSKSIDRVSN